MLSWFFKKRGEVGAREVPAVPAPAPAVAPAAKAVQAEVDRSAWAGRLRAALGDEAALLRLAQATPVLEIKLAAVEALASEDALRQAEREFRSHDRRVHRLARQRLDAAVAQRQTQARAQDLIDTAAALAADAQVPLNHLVALDRDWQALDARWLEPGQQARFGELRARLDALLREQGQAQQAAARLEDQLRLQREQALPAAAPPAAPPPGPAPARPAAIQAANAEHRRQLEALLQPAEAALAEGRLGELERHLQAIDTLLETMDRAAPGEALRARVQALQAERARLKDWQKWGGGRAREDLVAEAEELARYTQAAAEPGSADAPRLRLKAQAEAIQALRLRWKELDRLGAAAPQALWQRFDAALQTAHQPVAAQQALLKEARRENLAAREALLATLEALPLPAAQDANPATDWRELVRAIDRFRQGWRQLGPLEHTVPAAARAALQERLRGSLDRVEAPLQAARRAAEAVRERLIADAEALLSTATDDGLRADAMRRVRELQSDWQQHARSLPLARTVEDALWARFKAATDAVHARREAAIEARDAEWAARMAAREARDAARVASAGQARARWQAQCDALAARLAWCEARESGGADGDEPGPHSAAAGSLPAAWEQALAGRWSAPVAPGPLPAAAIDDVLLQLEAALDLPSAPEWQAARRDLKLRAMKNALEGRAAAGTAAPWNAADALAAGVRQCAPTPAQRDRLRRIVSALREAPAGTLGLPLAAA